ncbi:hypothetical protein E6H21_02180 [Candidatus Bathyarchaeota archaeon]|nr:MAG: hypothetical protein E6H21_02180 [Candidatus Bathyarchaeota archaeon]
MKSVDRLKHPVTTSSTSKYAEEVAGVLAVNGRFFMLCSSGKGLSTGWTTKGNPWRNRSNILPILQHQVH